MKSKSYQSRGPEQPSDAISWFAPIRHEDIINSC
jgi:hypothetical protein